VAQADKPKKWLKVHKFFVVLLMAKRVATLSESAVGHGLRSELVLSRTEWQH